MERVGEVEWVLDSLEELESDFSAFHRIDDIYGMPGPRFFRLARQIMVYQGAVLAKALRQREQQQAPARPAAAPPVGAGPKVVEAERSTLQAHESFSDLIDWG